MATTSSARSRLHQRGERWPRRSPRHGRSLLQSLSTSAWETFDARSCKHNRVISVYAEDAAALALPREKCLALFAKQKLTPVLPPLARLDCLTNNEIMARVEIITGDPRLAITVAADDEARLLRWTELLSEYVPGARIDPKAPSIVWR